VANYLTRQQVAEVERLLGAGLSQRAAARQARVHPATVAKIAAGRWQDPAARHRERGKWGEEVTPFVGRRERCPSCGVEVIVPCLACRIRGLLAAGRMKRRPGFALGLRGSPDELRLELRPADHRRYLRVRARKLAVEGLPGASGVEPAPEEWFVGHDDAPAVEELGPKVVEADPDEAAELGHGGDGLGAGG